jgi:hypothetical protein
MPAEKALPPLFDLSLSYLIEFSVVDDFLMWKIFIL